MISTTKKPASFLNVRFFSFEPSSEDSEKTYAIFHKELSTWSGHFIDTLPEYEKYGSTNEMRKWAEEKMRYEMTLYIDANDRLLYIFHANCDLRLEVDFQNDAMGRLILMDIYEPMPMSWAFFEPYLALSAEAQQHVFCKVQLQNGKGEICHLPEIAKLFNTAKDDGGDVSRFIIHPFDYMAKAIFKGSTWDR